MNVPFADLKKQYRDIKGEVKSVIDTLFDDFQFIGSLNNPHVKEFERNFSRYIGVSNVVGCANGTDAIEIALKSIGIKSGDEVIVPAISWFSTSEAVSTVGAIPVFVDVNDYDLTIDPSKIESVISEKTKAIIPVHLYGNAANMGAVMKIAAEYNLKVLEDCAQAHGAKFEGETVGTIGDIATFSFYPGKNLGAYGDAGAVVTNNDEYARVARLICQHGQSKKHMHEIEGRNSRLDGIQAAVLNIKLKYIEDWTQKRRSIAKKYDENIKNPQISLLKPLSSSGSVYHLYVIKTTERERLIHYLKERGIGTAIHYPMPLPFLEPYRKYNLDKSSFKMANALKDQILSIPMFPEMNDEEVNYVIESLNGF